MRILVALDGSALGERAAAVVARWAAGTESMDVHLLSVVHPDEVHSTAESAFSGEFVDSDAGRGHIPTVTTAQYGPPAAVPTGERAPSIVENRGQALARAREAREEYLQQIARRFGPEVTVGTEVEFSEHIPETILEVASRLRVDTIAMSTHGRTGAMHLLMGSVAERVVRQSPAPVIVVGPHCLAGGATGAGA